MIEVNVNVAIPKALLAYPDIIADTIPDIVGAIHAKIASLAQERLTSSYDDYVQGLQPPKFHVQGKLPEGRETLVATIVLVGQVPNMIENGWAGGDMKPALLAGRNAKQGKDGPYNVVPFRHSTPGTTGRIGAVMGSQFHKAGMMTRDAAEDLGKRVHEEAKKLRATTTHARTKQTQWGDRLAAGMAPKLKEHHKTDIYAGMVRQEKTYQKATQSHYTTFRAVSHNSDPQAWIHPGIEARHLFNDAAEYGGQVAGFLLQQAAQGLDRGSR